MKTPEQEAYRISRVQAALKGRPATDAQSEARAEGLRKAWAEGRIKPSSTPESVAKTAAKLRGRKRPKDLMERIRLKNIGKKRTAEMVAKMRQRLIDGYASGKYRLSEEAIAARNIKISEARKGWQPTWERRRHHSEVMKVHKWSAEVIEKRAAPMRGRPQTAEATKIGPTNKNSLEGALRDACGQLWRFRNLTDFVNTHRNLFDASDLVPEIRRGKQSRNCNASKRLLGLFGRGKTTPGSWKGWTAVSGTELGEDLMGRNTK